MRLFPTRLNDKPYWVFHPGRLVRRALYRLPAGAADGDTVAVARLPWGLELEVYPREAIGFTVLTAGVFDPCVSEAIFRLVDPGDLVVDVGANIGYLTSLAAARAGPAGTVIAYEPHPRMFELLRSNVERWRGEPASARVEVHQLAVSGSAGLVQLAFGPRFEDDMGLARVHPAGGGTDDLELMTLPAVPLDETLGERPVGLLKVDVEGHGPEVLRGARRLLGAGLVRDVLFEDRRPYPDACTDLVEGAGYRLFGLDNDLFGLLLVEPGRRDATRGWPGPSYLATRDPERAAVRLRPRGWRIDGIGPAARWLRGRGRRRPR